MKYSKEEARRKVLNCAKQYQNKLLNKKLIIIYRERKDNCKRQVLSSKKWQLISSIFWQLSTSILYTPTDCSVGIFH